MGSEVLQVVVGQYFARRFLIVGSEVLVKLKGLSRSESQDGRFPC